MLCSGAGSNLAALLAAQARGELGRAQIRLLIVNRPDAGAITHAEAAGVPVRVLPHGDYATREAYDDALVAALRYAGVQIVALASFYATRHATLARRLPRARAQHPPVAAPGLSRRRGAAPSARARHAPHGLHGALRDPRARHGRGADHRAGRGARARRRRSVAALSARILVEEHRLYARAVRALAEGSFRVEGRRVRGGFAA